MIHIQYLNIANLDYAALYEKASPERRGRAGRYLRREDGLRCLAAEALLRYGVRQALGPGEFTLEKGPQGKPFLVGAENFHFNLSHSGQWVVLAWGGSPVGVDVEEIRMERGREELARRFFTPEEQAYVFRREEGLPKRFLEIWTGKESYLKYLGTGLSKSLLSFSVLSLTEVRFHRFSLAGDCCLTLCTQDKDCTLEEISPDRL